MTRDSCSLHTKKYVRTNETQVQAHYNKNGKSLLLVMMNVNGGKVTRSVISAMFR